MKKLSITLFATLMFIAAAFNVSAQTEQTRQVSGFNSIVSAGPFNVHIKMDGSESLKLSAPADIINDIETVVKNNKLEIKFKDEEKEKIEEKVHDKKIDVYVSAKSLSGITHTGSGEVKVDGTLNNDEIKFTMTGSGNITATVKTTNFHATVTGSGVINVDGSAEKGSFVVTGSGQLKADGLKTNTATVVVTGSGKAHVNADKTLTSTVTGSGNVEHSGSATVTELRSGRSRNTRRSDR